MEKDNNINEGFGYSQSDIAKKLGVTQVTVCRWHKAGKFKGCFVRVNGKISYSWDAIRAKFGG